MCLICRAVNNRITESAMYDKTPFLLWLSPISPIMKLLDKNNEIICDDRNKIKIRIKKSSCRVNLDFFLRKNLIICPINQLPISSKMINLGVLNGSSAFM